MIEQEPAAVADSVVPAIVQDPLATAKVTAPVPLPPVVLSVEVPVVRMVEGVATATNAACATGGGVLLPPQATKKVVAKMLQAARDRKSVV